MDFSNVCRTCLGTESLNTIFKDSDDHTRYSTALHLTTGLKVEPNDGLPQNMCTSCISQLNSSMKFRSLCKDTETQLLVMKGRLDTGASNLLAYTCRKSSLKRKKARECIPLSTKSSEINIEYAEPDKEIQANNSDTEESEEKLEQMDMEPYSDDDDTPLKNLVNVKSKIDTGKVEIKGVEAPSKPYIPSSTPNRVICQLCQKELSIRSISAHVARRHPAACGGGGGGGPGMRRRGYVQDGEGYTCGHCKLKFDSAEVVEEHVQSCAKKKKRKASESSKELCECSQCHKVMQRGSLRLHTAVAHAGLRPVCEHCGRRFGNAFRLREHCRARHGHDKYKCTRCDFQSAAISAMRNHERRHRGEKPFVCEACGARFHAAYLLAQHRHKHRALRLVQCPQCPATFKSRNSLHMHRLTCHSPARYQCTMCARAYSCRHYAVKHIRLVHRYRGPVPPLQRLPPAPDPPPA